MIFLWVCLWCLTCADSLFGNKNGFTDIRNDLLKEYNRNARPVKDHNNNTTVKFAISLNNLNLDDHAQKMTAVTFLLISWNDEFLKWNPSDYGNIDSLHFDKEEIWMPDLALFNSAKSTNVAPTSSLPVVCYPDGTLLWVPPFTAEVPCQIDIEFWPSDVHTCALRFGSWAHHGEQINLQLVDEQPILTDFYEKNKRWSIVNYTATKETTRYKDEVYLHIDFIITVKREAASHAAYVTQTVFGVIILILGSYFLPLTFHLSRFLLHLFSISILLTCNFVLFLSLPATGGNIPHVVKFFSGSIILTTLSLLCNVILVSTMTSSSGVQNSFTKKISSILKSDTSSSIEFDRREVGYSNLTEELVETPPNSDESTSNQEKKREHKKDTAKLYRILNALLFCTFAVAFIIDYTIMRKTIGY